MMKISAVSLILLLFAAACASLPVSTPEPIHQPVTVTSEALYSDASRCTGEFVPHTFDHTTTITRDVVEMFDSNGAGLAINDLDNDGWLDVVLANLGGKNAIFWNEGNLRFSKAPLTHGQSRAANIVDVDGDGQLDIVFTRQFGGPTYWRNEGDRTFIEEILPGVRKPAYAMNWSDLDGDDDLDLVAASYDAALEKDLGDGFMFGEGAGVFFYENQDGEFVPQRLAEDAQGLAVSLADFNDDGRSDILVGNDFAIFDQVWLNEPGTWSPAEPFDTTTHSTMSVDTGDINNDGSLELLAMDMHPYADDPQTHFAWGPVMEMMPHHEMEDDPQIMENVLQVRHKDGRFQNQAAAYGLDATGWSWSTKFGDLDQDGFLDVYVVNGMAAAELFNHLVDNELVEENQALRNLAGGRFTPMPEWGLNTTAGGRGMSMADMDNDGDLDIVVNNLLSPAQLIENRLCSGASLQVDLSWPDSDNTRALGAELTLVTDNGRYLRDVRAASGYLSGDPARIHFGFPIDSELQRLEILWPDGTFSTVEPVPANALLRVERS